MVKRFITVFFVTIAILILSCVIFALVLFLAPGFSVFGVKYIMSGTHVYNQKFYIDDVVDSSKFSGSIQVEAGTIPIDIEFTQSYYYQVYYYDNFCGITNSNITDPTISVTLADNGTAVISVSTFNKFIYENSSSNRRLKVLIPAVTVATLKGGRTDLTIVSKSSNINFADETDDYYDPYFHQINIKTNGKITFATEVKADTYKLETINSIKVGENSKSTVNATNYILNSTGGNITVLRDVSGNISATTKNGNVKIKSCNNLDVDSGYGNVGSSVDNEDLNIKGNVNIKTTAGNVNIGEILGTSAESVIKTTSGYVNIKRLYDAKITTTRGSVAVNSARNVDVTTGSGKITVETAEKSVSATSKRGKIFLGGETMVVMNPKVVSTYGKVNVYSASGVVDIETVDADVVFVNSNATKTSLKVGGALNATKLTGSVDIYVEKTSTISFAKLTVDSKITGGEKCGNLNVFLYSNSESDFAYILEGSVVNLFEKSNGDMEEVYRINGGVPSLTGGALGLPKLTVTNKGTVNVYRGATRN